MKTKSLFIALTVSLFAISSCQKADVNPVEKVNQPGSNTGNVTQPVSGSKVRPSGFAGDCSPIQTLLMTDQNVNAGTVTVTTGAKGYIYVTYECTDIWNLTKTELYVGDCQLIPIGLDGTPDLDNYPNITTHSGITSYTYIIPSSLIPYGTCGCISAHAKIVDANGSSQEISAWATSNTILDSGSDKSIFSFPFCACQ